MSGTPGGTDEHPATFFTDPDELRRWFEAHHDTAAELWMGLNQKHVDPRGVRWAEAVEVALCFGWIDSLSQRIDDDARRQRWTPRRAGSNWSKVNVTLVEKLVADGQMTPAGLAAFERRRPDREGVYSYEQKDGPASDPVLPPAFEERLRANEGAAAFLDAATAAYRRNAVQWVLAAKRAETQKKRLVDLIDDSAHGRLIKPLRYSAEPVWAKRAREELGLG